MGVTGIPTFVIGNQGVVGCESYDVLARFVEAAGARKKIRA
jgi:predicted DsbA family dithiol-disulfide isomerase